MKTKFFFLLFVLGWAEWARAQGTVFTYQGRLMDNGAMANGNFDLMFSLFAQSSGGDPLSSANVRPAVAVSNGLFTVSLDFGGSIFNGSERWLEISVRTNAAGAFVALNPRQRVTAAPYAITAGNLTGVLPSGGLGGTYSSAVTFNNVANGFTGSFSGNGGALSNVNATTLAGLNTSHFWKVAGNSGESPSVGGSFLGFTDNQPLELKVNNQRLGRLAIGYNDSGAFGSTSSAPNVIWGAPANYVANGVIGATIAGGGSIFSSGLSYSNSVLGDFGTVSGGYNNTARSIYATVGGGFNNTAAGPEESTVSGGGRNTASGRSATVSGGLDNTASGDRATVGGGWVNAASSESATVSGGQRNTSSNDFATVPGGFLNAAGGRYSFAAGRRSQALHDGTHVWADATDADFASTGLNQFLIRAGGGVGINTNNPAGAALSVAGTVRASSFVGDGSLVTGLNASSLTTGIVPDSLIPAAIARDSEILPTVLAGDGPGSGLDADTLDGLDSTALWKLGGNSGTMPGADFLGTTDDRPLEFKVNNSRVLRLEPAGSNSVNVVGGASVNMVALGVVGAAIAGGGAGNYSGSALSNRVDADFGSIGGGAGNTIGTNASYSTIGGGDRNTVQSGAYKSTIGGGERNTIEAITSLSSIAGGLQNTIQSHTDIGTVGGGGGNTIQANADLGTIGGGGGNTVQTNAGSATIGGGYANTIQTNAYASTISGGGYNVIRINANYSIIGGGGANTIQSNAFESTIGGGAYNIVFPDAFRSTIAGGRFNEIWYEAPYSSIGGGGGNRIRSYAMESVIAGGTNNLIDFGGLQSVIGGGEGNVINANGLRGFIGGGAFNSVLAGGQYGMVVGGYANAAAERAFAAGTRAKANHSGSFVWADFTDTDFASSAPNQFLIRASGGVGIGTNNPQCALHVASADMFMGKSRTGNFGEAAGFVFNPNYPQSVGLVIEQAFNGESAGIYLDSDFMSIWSPGDFNRLLRVYDEDGMVERFYIDGAGNAVAGGMILTSSRRFKEHIVPIADALDKVSRLQGVTFDWVKDKGGKSGLGFIAEDVAGVLPELVLWEENGKDAVGLQYANLTAVTVEAIKELKAQKDSEIESLRTTNAQMEGRLAEMEKHLAELEARQKDRDRRLSELETLLQEVIGHAHKTNLQHGEER